MPLSQSSLAAAVGAGAKNVKFQSAALNVPRKIVVIGTYDASKTTIVDEVPELSLGPAWGGDKYGFGSMIHRLLEALEEGSQGVETWVCPQAEEGAAVAAAGSIAFAGSDVTENGTFYLYIAGLPCHVSLEIGDDGDAIVDKIVAKATELKGLPVTAAESTPTTTVDLTAKSKGPWGNDIAITFNEGFQEKTPAGVTLVVTDMTGGSGLPDIQDALDGLGTEDDANEKQFTDGVHGYGQDETTLNAISTWGGVGNDFVGLYSKTVARPIRFLTGDTAAGASGLSALITLGDGRKSDRTNGVVPVPGSPNHPAEIAAKTVGIMARLNNDRAAESYVGKVLPNVYPGALADRWTRSYDDRDTAVKAGISTTVVEGGAVLLQDVVSFYHPDSVSDDSNGYRSMRNISIIQNLLDNIRSNFKAEGWQGISIVADVAKVTNPIDRQKARDLDAVLDDLVALAESFESRAWLFSAAFTVNKLKSGGYLAIRSGGKGFDMVFPVLLSGEGTIFNNEVHFDTSLSVIL